MKNYALYLGCNIPARQPNYELSSRKAFKELDIDLIDLDKTTCCAPPPIESVDLKISVAVAAYNICLAEEQGLDLVTLCSGCFQSLAKANVLLKKDDHLRREINKILSHAGKEFRGESEVKHYLQVFIQDVGVKKIKDRVVKPLNVLKVASFYGCHLIRPSSLLKFDDAERPHILDDLVKVTGAESIEYWNKKKCCGGLLRGHADDLALEIARDKIVNISNAGADCIVTVCPFCFIAFDIGQFQLRRQFNESYEIPVLHYPELLCLSLGVEPKELAMENRRIKADKILNKIG